MEEKTSNKIMKIMEFDDAVYYRANCGCGSEDHDLALELEYDSELNDISLNMYKKLIYCSEFGINPSDKLYALKSIYYRIKGALTLLLTGVVEVEESFLFTSSEQINHFIIALQEGIEKLNTKNVKNDKKSK